MQLITFTSGTFFRLRHPSVIIPPSHAAHWPAPPRQLPPERRLWLSIATRQLHANDPHTAALPTRKPPTRWASTTANLVYAFVNWPQSTSHVPDLVLRKSLRKRSVRGLIGWGWQSAWVEKSRLDWLSGLHRSLLRPRPGLASSVVLCCPTGVLLFSLSRVRCRMVPFDTTANRHGRLIVPGGADRSLGCCVGGRGPRHPAGRWSALSLS